MNRTITLNDYLKTEKNIVEKIKKQGTDQERIEQYYKLCAELHTMDMEKAKNTNIKLIEFKMMEQIRVFPEFHFKDNTTISIQASVAHYCTPPLTLLDLELYKCFEVKTNFKVNGWNDEIYERGIYSFVDADKVKKLLEIKINKVGILI